MKLRIWVDIAEITASVAVVVTLLLLVFQMRESDKLERVHNSVRMAQWDSELFVQSDQLPIIMAKLEAVQNPGFLQEFRDRYGLTMEEAGIWNRWLLLLWKSLETEFITVGPSDALSERIRIMSRYEDQRLVILPLVTSLNPLFVPEFTQYVNNLLDDDSEH